MAFREAEQTVLAWKCQQLGWGESAAKAWAHMPPHRLYNLLLPPNITLRNGWDHLPSALVTQLVLAAALNVSFNLTAPVRGPGWGEPQLPGQLH